MGKNPAQKAKAVENKKAAEGGSKKVEGRAAKKPAKTGKKLHATSAKRADRKCKIGSCKRGYRAKGYCGMHYKKWRHGAFGRARYKTCSDLSCKKPMVRNRHGYCEDHFQNYYVKGMAVAKAAPAAAPAKEEKKESAA